MKSFLFFSIFIFFITSVFAQVNSFVNSSFENYNNCVATMSPAHSQFGNVVFGWENAFASNISTADFFTNGDACSFVGFNSLTNTVSLASSSASKGCSWAGIYLNYFETSSINTKYREYIAQNVSLINGTTYTVELDLARSNHPSSNTLEVDLAIYGYNGLIPAGQVDYCLINSNGTAATLLGTVNRSSIGTAFNTFTTTFTPSQNFDYLVIGGASCGTEASAIGYVFIDNVKLTANNNSIVNPVIESCSNGGFCGLHCLKQSFDLVGNTPQVGITSTWSQSINNPEQITFTTPNLPTTNIVETGSFVTGTYEFYYTFSNGTTTVTDTAKIDIFEYSIVNSFTAGQDINICNGSPDSTGQKRGVQISGALPNGVEMANYNATGWWSMIRNNGSEWTFPNGCNPGDGVDEGDVFTLNYLNMNCNSIIPYSTNSNDPSFFFRNAQDTVQFIWHIESTDDCGTTILLVDTLEVFYNDIDFSSTTTLFPYTSVCQGLTMVVTQDGNNSNVLPLQNSSNLNFLWSYTPQNGGLSIIDNTVSDSVQIVGVTVGDYVVRVRVFDASTGCSWYDIVDVSVSECSVYAGPDLAVGCDSSQLTNDATDANYLSVSRNVKRRVYMNAEPSDVTIQDNGMGSWWSMIRTDGTEWVFPNLCVPTDGYDEGDVFSINSTTACGNPTYGFPSASTALFNFRNAIDSVTFIWHIVMYDSISGISDTLVDTVEVVMQDVDFAYSSYANPEIPWRTTCEDTLLIHQHISPNFRPLENRDNLVFKWTLVKPNGSDFVPDITPDAHIIDNTLSDSILLVTSAGRRFRVLLEVTDTTSGCSWLDYVVVKRIMPIGIDAGVDSFACVSLTGDYIYEASADIWYEGVNSDPITKMSTWWSTERDDGTEWVFPNNCVPYDGINEGNVYVLNPANSNCNDVPNTLESNAMDCVFGIAFPGTRKLIWNALDNCTGEVLKDTILIGFGVLDQANAGLDKSVTCNVVSLEGNLSSLSSANSGYYFWEQITGPDSVSILSANANVGYFSTNNITAGVYSFQYTLGLAPCQTVDTVVITVIPTPPSSVEMTSNYDENTNYCQTDTLSFFATGGQQYAFLVDGAIVQPFSPIGTFSYANFTGLNEVTVLSNTGINNCIETLDSAHVITVQFLSPPNITAFPNYVCKGDQVSFSFPSNPDGSYSWQGPNGIMNVDTIFDVNYVTEDIQGNYLVSYSENNCFSDTSSFYLSVSKPYNANNFLYACLNDSVYYQGTYYSQTINFTDSLQTNMGCDSIINTNIVIGDTINKTVKICEGDSLFLSGSYQSTNGVFIDTYSISANCDSIIKTVLIVDPSYLIEIDSSVCFGDSIYFANSYIKTTGIYHDSLTSSLGCDSIIELNFNVEPLNKTNLRATICVGDSLFVFSQYENQAGLFTEIYTASNGCDSVVDFVLVVQNEQLITQEQNICEGDSIFLSNSHQFTNGVYYDTLASIYGCDSIIESVLSVRSNYFFYDTLSACGNYYWSVNNVSYNNSGSYTETYTTEFGCDSILNLQLEIIPIESSVLELPFFCDSAFIKKSWYYTSQIVTDTLLAKSGCDSLVYISLDIRDCSTTSNFSDLYIPNVFTPNDDGTNDAFIITSFGKIIEEGASLQIYNRWGLKLFESNALIKWSGGKHSDGTYYYIFKYKGENFTGHINLIRDF